MADGARRCIATWIVLAMACAAMNAQAVVQNVAVVTPEGQPVANATVTIVFPDGTQEEDDTDDKGILCFDFPNSGNYKIRYGAGPNYPAGEIAYVVTSSSVGEEGGPNWVPIALTTLGVGGAIAGFAGSDDDDDDDDGPQTPGGGGNGGGSESSSFNCTPSQVANQDGHPTGSLGGTYNLTTDGSNATLQHTSGNTDFSIQGTLSGDNLTASGTGTFVGRTNSQFSFTGTAPPLQGQLRVICEACPDTDGDNTADPVDVNQSCTAN
jgi:hypothetical protein